MMKFYMMIAALAVVLSSPALAGSNTDIAIVSPAGSDANDCVWRTPFKMPLPPACKTATHAATLLHGPGSTLGFMAGTYNEIVAIHVNKANWSSAGSAFRIGVFPEGSDVKFTGGFVYTGDGWMSHRGIKFESCLGDCIKVAGTSVSDPMHGGILNTNIYSSNAHAVNLLNTEDFELGYNFFKNTDLPIIIAVNSANLNIHETSCLMDVKKTPQLCGSLLNSPNALFDTHVDIYTAPTDLNAINSPGLHDPIIDASRKGNVCPSSDVKTDTFSASWSAITSIGCIVQ